MESVIESYQKGNYEQALNESSKVGNSLIECKALLKLNQMKSPIPFGAQISKDQGEYFTRALQKVQSLSDQDKLQVQMIIDYYQDKEVNAGTTEESKLYFGLCQFEKEEYEAALATLYSVGNLENVDDRKHKYLMIAECYIRLEKYNKATRFLEYVGENSYCYALLSQCYFKMGNTQQANMWMKESLKINQNCFYAQLNQLRQFNNIDEEIKLIEKQQENNLRITKQMIYSYIAKGSQRTNNCMGEYACRPRGECVQKCLQLIDKIQKCKATDFLKAQIMYFNYKNTEALTLFNSCIESNYKALESRFYIAMIHKDQMKYKECMGEFKVLSQQPQIKDDCHFWRVVIFIELHEYEQALRELEHVQTSAKNYALISKLYYLRGNKVQADIWLKEALKLDPNCFYAKVEKGAQDVKFECITLLESLLKDDSFNLCAKEGLIKLLIQHAQDSIQFQWGEYSCKPQGPEIQRAVQLLEQVKNVRECIKHDFYSGVVNYYLNNLQQSEQLFKKCIDANYQFWTCKYYLSLIKKDQMKYKEALDLFLEVADHEDQFTQDCHANRAWIYIQQNLPDKAIKELEKNKHGCQYYVLLGQAYIMKGNSVQANTWFNESLKVNSDCLYAKIDKAILAQKQDEILKFLDNAQKIDPENYVIMWHRGKVLVRLNKQEQALQLFDKCIQYKHNIAYASKAKVLRCQGKLEEALQVGNECTLPPIIVVKASILFDQKKFEESIQMCEPLCTEKNVHAMRQKALALKALNKKEEALKLYDDILAIDKFNIQAYVGKAQIIKETEDIYELLNQLSDIVMHKKMYKATMNPVVVHNCLDLLQLYSEFDTKENMIEKVIEQSQQHEKQKQELIQLKQQKEKLCSEKIECIMNPICHLTADNTQDVLKRLNALHKQMTDIQLKQQTQTYESLLLSTTFSEGSIEQIDFENQIKKWNENNADQDKQNYVTVYTNLLINHIQAYSQILHEQIPQTNIDLQLGNSVKLIDEIIDNTFTVVTLIKYTNRMKALLKLIKSNELTNRCGNNLQLIIGLCAQTCADQIDFTKEVQSIQSHAFKYQQKFLMQQVDSFTSKCQLPQLQLLSGKYAIRDVLITIAYLQHNFISLIGKSKQVPLNQWLIQLNSKHVQLTTECHPVNQHFSEYVSAFNIKDYKPEMKRTQGDSGCCIVM